MYYSDSGSGSESEDYEFYETTSQVGFPRNLPFDPVRLETLLLKVFDKFDFRVVLSDERTRAAALVTTGLSLAGGVIGKRFGGNFGAAVGGAVGGVVGLGLAVVTLREIWEEVKYKLSHLFDILYDHLAALEVQDYAQAAMLLTQDKDFAMLIGQVAQVALGKRVLQQNSNV